MTLETLKFKSNNFLSDNGYVGYSPICAIYNLSMKSYDSVYYISKPVFGVKYGLRVSSNKILGHYILNDDSQFDIFKNGVHCVEYDPATYKTLSKYVITDDFSITTEYKMVNNVVKQVNYLGNWQFLNKSIVDTASIYIEKTKIIGYSFKPYGLIILTEV